MPQAWPIPSVYGTVTQFPPYVRVTADMVHANAMDYKLDFPTPDTKTDTLRGAKNDFILWPQ